MRAIDRMIPFAVALVALLGCGGIGQADRPAATSAAPPTSTTTAPASGFSVTDTAWLQLAIAMDERALEVLDLVPSRIRDPAVKELAERFAAEHRDELARLYALHARSGGPTTNPHEGHDMPGMATGQEVKAMEGASGAGAEGLFTGAMRAHIDQSIRLAQAEQRSGTEPAAKALAAEIERSRTDQRRRLDQL